MASAGFGIKNDDGDGFVSKLENDGDTKLGDTSGDLIQITGTLEVAGGAVFNQGSIDVDFRVESNNETHMFYLDGGANRIGIGTNSPQSVLHIIDPLEGTGAERDAIIILKSRKDVGIKLIADSDNSGENDNPFIDFYQDGSADTSGRNNRLGTIAMEGDADGTFTGSIGNAFFMDAFHPNVGHSSRPLQLANASTNGGHSARITLEGTNGYVGIHTTTPDFPLEVSGNTRVAGTTTSQFYVTNVAEQDLGSGTSSTLTLASGTMLLDADSINGIDMEVHGLAIARGGNSGTRLSLILKGSSNNVFILPTGLISGTFGSINPAANVSALEFVWIKEGTHQAWHQA